MRVHVSVTTIRSDVVKTYSVGDIRVCSIVGKRGSTPSVGMGLGQTLSG